MNRGKMETKDNSISYTSSGNNVLLVQQEGVNYISLYYAQ